MFITLLILEIKKKIYKTEEHPSVAITMNSIAQHLFKMKMFTQALQMSEKTFG